MHSALRVPHSALLLLGPTGAGKTPLGEALEGQGLWGRRCLHFDFGENLRRVAAGEGDFSDTERAFVNDVLGKGVLLENETFDIAEKILGSFLEERRCQAGDLVVLNGLPRHAGQARDIDGLLDVRLVLHLVCSVDVVHERIRVNAGGDRAGREDDALEAVSARLDLFRERTIPLLDHYRAKGVRIEALNVEVGTQPTDMVSHLEGRDSLGEMATNSQDMA